MWSVVVEWLSTVNDRLYCIIKRQYRPVGASTPLCSPLVHHHCLLPLLLLLNQCYLFQRCVILPEKDWQHCHWMQWWCNIFYCFFYYAPLATFYKQKHDWHTDSSNCLHLLFFLHLLDEHLYTKSVRCSDILDNCHSWICFVFSFVLTLFLIKRYPIIIHVQFCVVQVALVTRKYWCNCYVLQKIKEFLLLECILCDYLL